MTGQQAPSWAGGVPIATYPGGSALEAIPDDAELVILEAGKTPELECHPAEDLAVEQG